ncbi:MAG: hypothetical protein ACRDNK_23540, partial [Solirubrobacteraceae bacterium]
MSRGRLISASLVTSALLLAPVPAQATTRPLLGHLLPVQYGQHTHHRKLRAHGQHPHPVKRALPIARIAGGPRPARRGQRVPAPAAPVSGRTFYVSVSGSDSNSGTSPGQAWQTVGRVNRASLAPGDGV